MSGAGQPIEIRRMRRADIGAATRLKQSACWNQTYADWRRFLAISSGSFVAVRAGRVVGSVTSCVFGGTGWIGMMLVDVVHRRQGIATRLMQQVLAALESQGCRAIRLDATSLGAPVYRLLGFRDEYEVIRYGGLARGFSGSGLRAGLEARPRPFCWRDWQGVQHLDREMLRIDRTKLLKRLILEQLHSARVVESQGRLTGYALQRAGSVARMIGPLAATTVDVGTALLIDALGQARRCRVKIDIPALNQPARDVVESVGLSREREFIRMVRGETPAACPVWMWASSGPEKG